MPGNIDRLLSLLLLLLLPLQGVMGDTVWFLYDAQNEHHKQYVAGSEALLRETLPMVSVVQTDTAQGVGESAPGERTLLITVGPTAARQAAQSGLPTLTTLLTQRNFEALRAEYEAPVSALYIDQPVRRQLQLVKSALPLRRQLTVLVGRESQALVSELTHHTRLLGLALRVIQVDEDSVIEQLFEHELSGEDTLLLLPDPEVVNRRTVKPLVLGSYRQGLPLIGYSHALVKAGALMAVHSSQTTLQQQAVVMVQNYFADNRLPAARYAEEFEVSINYQLARALKITLPSEKTLKQTLQEQLQ
jgi:putative ABC transport system substrate-binding protein